MSHFDDFAKHNAERKMEQSDKSSSSSRIPPFLRDRRDSLEVFNPSSSSSLTGKPTDSPFRSEPKWKSWSETHSTHEPEPAELFSFDTGQTNEITENISWMALEKPNLTTQSSSPLSQQTFSAILNDAAQKSPSGKYFPRKVGAAALRAAEWGLVLETDTETGKLQGVSARYSGGEEPSSKVSGTSRRNTNNWLRSSEDTQDDGGKENLGIPRISEYLKDALSAFQQSFLVCDATTPDYPIMYASAGFFKLTGYTSKEVVGRNCRFLQGAGTDPEGVAKIREALEAGTSYSGRLLNYKKDGTPFWNLLTLAPIKDDSGTIVKVIGMQVEVSKYTEGSKEKMLRPNGLPESLIRYDARQKDRAVSSVSELLQAVKRPRALSESANPPLMIRKSEGSEEEDHKAAGNLSRRRSESVASSRQKSQPEITSMQPITELPEKKLKNSSRIAFMGFNKKSQSNVESFENEIVAEDSYGSEDEERADNFDDLVMQREKRKGLDLATTLERIEKNFVITDPRLSDNPIIFASDSFLELTEYSREEILGRNCRFLQGPETDRATVRKIREAIDNQTEVTVQLINYTKSGKKFWNLFHLQPMRDHKGEVQYFIGVQLDGSRHVEPLNNCIANETAIEGEKMVKQTAENVDDAVRELPDANLTPEDLWINHSKVVHPKPHRKNDPAWEAIQKIIKSGQEIGLKHFRPIKPLGSGDTGSVHLVELCGTGQYFAMKVMDKSVMLNRNKVHRACTEREILDMLDHPFLPALYASFQTKTHVCLITDYCAGGELFLLLDRQPTKVLKEDAVRFYAAEVVVALEYLHCQGIIYRDLKPENVLLQRNGHVALTDFDLSCLTSCKPQLLVPATNGKKKKRKKKQKGQPDPVFLAEPVRASNSFVGTEEYIAPEIITGAGHTSAVDWWALGILLYEMLYGYTPFRGKTRQRTFSNILHKDLKFPKSRPVSLHAKQLMHRLLHRDPKKRLGSQEGSNEIKRHPFFRGVNWALVRCMKPPELDAPLLEQTEGENEPLDVNPALEDLETNVF